MEYRESDLRMYAYKISVVQKFYSFGGMFLLTETSGVIIHYKSDSSSRDTMLWIDTGTLNIYRKHLIYECMLTK
jgi:hypothetical protein